MGFANSGIDLLAPNKDNLVKAVNALEPTTEPAVQVQPGATPACCIGAKRLLDTGGYEAPGGNGERSCWTPALSLGDDPYRYPDNLPVIGAKGGPGGKPGCGSLPDVAKNFPVRQLVTNTGFGTGMDMRPNPGIGFPAWANFFPVTRAVPEPPSIRNLFGGPALGPDPVPGSPALRSAAVRAGRHAAVAGPAAGTAADGAARTRSDTRLRTVRRPGARADAADAAAADPLPGRPHHRRDRRRQTIDRARA